MGAEIQGTHLAGTFGASPGPVYWRDEPSGELAAAVYAYLHHVRYRHALAPTPEQLQRLIAYLRDWVNAPCWGEDRELRQLRASAMQLATVKQIKQWLRRAVTYGIDPL